MERIDEFQGIFSDLLGELERSEEFSNLLSILMAAAAYVFMGLGLYAMAKKRCIRKPWLAWVPVGSLWLMGCISDQYRYFNGGRDPKRRRTLLIYGILSTVGAAVLLILFQVLRSKGVFKELTPANLLEMESSATMAVIFFLLLAAEVMVSSILAQIYYCIALRDIFHSADASRAKLFSIIGIIASCLGSELPAAIFIFLCRNKEEGMPPRIEQ